MTKCLRLLLSTHDSIYMRLWTNDSNNYTCKFVSSVRWWRPSNIKLRIVVHQQFYWRRTAQARAWTQNKSSKPSVCCTIRMTTVICLQYAHHQTRRSGAECSWIILHPAKNLLLLKLRYSSTTLWHKHIVLERNASEHQNNNLTTMYTIY